MAFEQKDLIGLRQLGKKELTAILDQAAFLKADFTSGSPVSFNRLQGKTFVQLFFEPSTRTRASFEMAIKKLGGACINIDIEHSSVKKGETLRDTVRNLEALGVDGVIVRHSHGGAPLFIANHIDVPVINAGDGYNEHPTQGLLDIFTLKEKLGNLKGKRILIVGDIAHSRVARSNIWGLKTLGAEVFVAGPPTLMPPDVDKLGVTVVRDVALALEAMDAVNVLRIQYERQDLSFFPSVREYRRFYALTTDNIQNAGKLVVMHPGPINRGTEIDTQVADGAQSVIMEQVRNGVMVRMAILDLLTGKDR